VVFSLVYRRFLDLRKAEEQARIASIEAALEKAREKAMGMRHSDDLTGTADAVFSELRSLRISPHRGGVGLVKKHTGKVLIYATSCSDAKGNLTVIGSEVFQDHRVLDEIYQRWKQEEYYPILDRGVPGLFLPGSPADFLLPEGVRGGRYFGYFLPFSEGFLYGWLEKPVTDADIDILDRFKTIVDLALRRYLELQKSELITRESLRQASLDRIRAEIASMRSTNDLERIIPLVWKELNTLGVPFIRCGVFIMDEQRQEIQAFLSAPEGESRAAFHLPFHTAGIIQEILEHWRKQVLLTQHWEKKDFDEWLDMLVEKGAMKANEQYITNAHPEKFDLHFFPFRQGMLYVGNTGSLGNEEIETVQAVTNSFATAYARYEDFTKLELAKQQVEKTLADLKQAQARLVQSEKLASLGELTAGIAHEIQNPLNFVNNFSEVSTELAAELEEAAARGNLEGIRTLAADIRSNQQKINEHGRRADAIVKSMFLHSRTGSGQKESTDINELCNEYLRLAYHASLSGRQGMQSKDLAAKVLVQTSFDKEAGRVDIIPQEIGRVLLNLYNNAFYALTDPQNASVSGYEPRLSVSTRKTGDTVIIEVKDNGPGIPEKIRDKIFQPFFTTKPTGQGTGLGLSLSYDIINAHGGEIRLESEEGEGTTFSVILPNG
jgi:signal transduction histidine kinase